ncbi:MAG: NUDIX domain-containing protein [Bacteroides sp.]|nr:NUDIX domain-containing protein [Bacteroides sp.]MBD5369484.1 NUDIX domain-containing protein [Bacteroides sp.]
MRDNSNELFPIVSPDGMVIGSATRGECHSGSKLLHPVVHIHVFDSDGRLFLQKRPEWKDIQPGKWDTSVGGHVDYGETIADAALRETREELSITNGDFKYLDRYVFESDREKELINAFRLMVESPDAIKPSAELDGGRFWEIEEIKSSLGKGIFTPNFESEFIRLGLGE